VSGPSRRTRLPALAAIAAAAVAFATEHGPLAAAPGLPAWLAARPGTLALVDQAPWYDSDEPEAALTASAASLKRDFSTDPARPDDVVYRPIGVRVRIARLVGGSHLALVYGITERAERWTAYAPLDRLVPEIPPGTILRAAGGFGGFADFYPALDSRQEQAARIATGSQLVALGVGVAPFDPDSPDLVRVHVRVLSGRRKGSSGWIGAAYTGIPAGPGAVTSAPERACGCRLAAFSNL